MSAKLLHALTDDNSDLQKQIGCMTGIFHLFDRQNILTGRPINGHGHKKLKLPPEHSQIKGGNPRAYLNNVTYLQTSAEKNLHRNMEEDKRVTLESPRASLSSSSRSSSFSSLDCHKAVQPESLFSDRTFSPAMISRDTPLNQPNASPQLSRQSIDFRHMVKDAIYRDVSWSSAKITNNEEVVTCVVNGSSVVGASGKPRVPVDLNESLRVLAELRNVFKEQPKSANKFSVSKDTPRLSCDAREIPCSSFESGETFKSPIKARELPRMSLDSREGSMRGYISNTSLKDLQRGMGNPNIIPSPQKETGTHSRSPTVVAKLMGLEALPNSISVSNSKTELTNSVCNHNILSRSSKTNEKTKQNWFLGSPKSSLKDPISPRSRISDFVMKPIPSSRFPIEPAPWRQQYGSRGFQKQSLGNQEAPARAPDSYTSVYSEIEKRLKELEFKQSDKDLRALHRILEAMQSEGLLDTKKEDLIFISAPQRTLNHPNHPILNRHPSFANRQNPQDNRDTSPTLKETPLRTFESPIVIIKPAKLTRRSDMLASSVIPNDGLSGLRKPRSGDSEDNKKGFVNNRKTKEPATKQNHRETANQLLNSKDKISHGRTSRSTQISARSKQLPRENTGNPEKSSGSVSFRVQQKKLGLEKQSRPRTLSPDSSNPGRQFIKQLAEAGSPCGKLRPRSPNLQQSNDELIKINSERRKLYNKGDETSLQSDSNISLATQVDVEVTSTDQSAEFNTDFYQQNSQSLPRKDFKNSASSVKQTKPAPRLSEDRSFAKVASPVSVLDVREDLQSRVKKRSNTVEDDETQSPSCNLDDYEWDPVDLDHTSNNMGLHISTDTSRKKVESVNHLVQKLRRLNSNHDEANTDYIASLCDNTNPDHRYISEMLLTSGLLLRGLNSGLAAIQLHQSGQPINPDLFFVLEQTKSKTGVTKDKDSSKEAAQLKPDQEKMHRKILFDAVNEFLLEKLNLVGHSTEPWHRGCKLLREKLGAQQLLKELCLEIEQLQPNKSNSNMSDNDGLKSILEEDVIRRSQNWTIFHWEVPGIVLDVERLIFKDLVDEIVNCKTASKKGKASRRCRRLFAG